MLRYQAISRFRSCGEQEGSDIVICIGILQMVRDLPEAVGSGLADLVRAGKVEYLQHFVKALIHCIADA